MLKRTCVTYQDKNEEAQASELPLPILYCSRLGRLRLNQPKARGYIAFLYSPMTNRNG